MNHFVAQRLVQVAIVVVCVSTISFFLVPLMPGDPAFYVVGEFSTPEQRAAARTELGLDRPLVAQYGIWISETIRGDLGESWSVRRGSSVASLIASRFGVTIALTIVASALAAIYALTTALLAVKFDGTILGRAIVAITSLGMSTPAFWTGLLLIYLISLRLRLLPAIGYEPFLPDTGEWFKHLIMPAVALSFRYGSELSRQLRDTLAHTMDSDYVRAAYARGVPGWRIFVIHGVRNAAIPVVTLFGLQVINLLGGSIIVEALFSLPGLGTLIIAAVTLRDIPIVQAMVLTFGITTVLLNFVVDALYGYLDPRVRLSAPS